MVIMVCDDDKHFYTCLRDYLSKNEIFAEADFVYCANGTEALERYAALAPDMVFMDIELGDVLGFDIVRRLLDMNENPRVVYITAHSHYVFEAFVGQPLGFVRKAHLEQDMELALSEIKRVFDTKLRTLTIRSGVSEYKLRLCKIVAFEMFGHRMTVHYLDGRTLTVRYTLDKIERQISGCGFVRISRNTLVNTLHIKCLKVDELFMKNDVKFYVTGKRLPDVDRALKAYNN